MSTWHKQCFFTAACRCNLTSASVKICINKNIVGDKSHENRREFDRTISRRSGNYQVTVSKKEIGCYKTYDEKNAENRHLVTKFKK